MFRVEDYTSTKQLASRALHGVIFQKTEIFTTTAVKTSNPTNRGGSSSIIDTAGLKAVGLYSAAK
jgi:hypothetical protein